MQDAINLTQDSNQLSLTKPTTGIWYSTWYANQGNYIWCDGHGIGSSSQMLADVNGDGRDDAVVYFGQTGEWYAALSNGNGFDGYNKWTAGHGVGSSLQMLGDVNGDAKADAIAYFGQTGEWYVALSQGNSFNGHNKWTAGHGIGSTSQMLGDVNGDTKADAVVYFGRTGEWYAALANGNGFDGYNKWIRGYGVGSNSQMLADINGDLKADAVAYYGKTGTWYTAVSNGNRFNHGSKSITGHGIGSNRQMLGDVNGDGLADAVVYFGQQNQGDWYVANSNKNGFNGYYHWKSEHGQASKYNNYQGSSWQGLGRVYSDKSSYAPVVYYPNQGEWRVLPSDKYSKPNILNTWEAWNIKSRPLTLGSYRTYDSQEIGVIDEHLKLLSEANIDFMILDLTNNIDVDEEYIKQRAQVVSQRIAVWNADSSHNPIKYAIAVGGMQFNGQPETLEQEADKVWHQFVNYIGADNYFHLDGKPLLISYSSYQQRNSWTKANINKSKTNNFNLQWAQGAVPDIENKKQVPSALEYNSYFGWAYPQGSLENDKVMVVMPNWNNGLGGYVPANENNNHGDFYQTKGWDRVLAQKPQMVVINSFNEFLEKTAIVQADTSALPSNEQLSSPSVYWNITVNNNAKYKGIKIYKGKS